MNDITDKAEDRFYEEVQPEIRKKMQSVEEKVQLVEYAPEPHHMLEGTKRGKFIVGNKYPLLGRKEFNVGVGGVCSRYTYRTKDENGTEMWMDEKFFIPSESRLTYEEECEFSKLYSKHVMLDSVQDEWVEEENPDIRKMAEEKGVKSWKEETTFVEASVLAGIKESDYSNDGNDNGGWQMWKSRPFYETVKSTCKPGPFGRCSNINEGVVKDYGNDVMYDANKCMAAVNREFGKNVVDPDDILAGINYLMGNHEVTWQEGYLAVNGAVTKISNDDVQKAYSGLQPLVSAKMATKAVSKLVASKLKKLF